MIRQFSEFQFLTLTGRRLVVLELVGILRALCFPGAPNPPSTAWPWEEFSEISFPNRAIDKRCLGSEEANRRQLHAPRAQVSNGSVASNPKLCFAGIPTRLRGGRAHEFPYGVQGQPIAAEGAYILGVSSRERGFRRMSTDIGRRPDRNEVRDRSFAFHVADVGKLRRCPWLTERSSPPAPASSYS